jgi:DNA modification methylase
VAYKILHGDCKELLERNYLGNIEFYKEIDLAFLDPPFNQGKHYASFYDNMPENDYWDWMEVVIKKIYELTSSGGALYFMQREKNAEYMLSILRKTGWTFQNLIIWKKMTSAIPGPIRYGKQYQIIVFATKGKKPRVFNRLRIDPPLLPHQKHKRENGVYVTDIWDDIRELTSGYFAGEEPIRIENGERFHKQQSPVQLLTRIILSSTKPGDLVLDPYAGTGTTSVVAEQLGRNSISIELDSTNFEEINKRLAILREPDDVSRFFSDYKYTENLDHIWPDMFLKSNKIDIG